MAVAPDPMFPEKGMPVFERALAPSVPGNKGPLRFQEGVASDTDVPNDFGVGAYADTSSSPVRMNHNNPEMFYKYPEETMRERAHVGSASWVEAPAMLSDFVQGAMSGDNVPQFEYVYGSGGHMNRPNIARVYD